MAESVVSRPLPSRSAARRAPRRGLGLGERGNLREALWRAAWSPFWLGSDSPSPRLPSRQPLPPAERGLAGDVVAGGLNQIQRRIWVRQALSTLVRATWLGIALGCLWLVVELGGGPPLHLATLAVTAGVVLLLGILFAALNQPTRRDTARMLDQSFGLQERLSTAVDHFGRGVPREGERASVVYLQMADAANAIAELRRNRSLGIAFPVRELVLTVFCGLLMAGLFFLRGVGGGIPEVTSSNIPVFTPAVELSPTPDPAVVAADEGELAPTIEDVQQRSERSHQAQSDLQALAEALQDHAVTRGAADAINRGDYETGANELRDLAPRTDQLSPSAREELARDLDAAAPQMSSASGDLNQAATEAAAGLREGGQVAEESVRELGEAVERTGGEVASQQELAEQMQRAEQAAAGQESQQGQSGSGQPGQPSSAQSGEAGMPGEGMPGDASNPQGEQQAGGQPGAMSEPGAGQPGAGGEGGQPGQAANPEAAAGSMQEGGQPGGEGAAEAMGEGAIGEGEQSAAGGGAGSGDAQAPPEEGQQAAGSGEAAAPTDAEGVPAEAKVSEGDGAAAEAGEPEPVSETITLPQGSDGSGIQTVNDAGGSRQGTGAGVTAGSGTAIQGEVGEAGPDSNRVPADYRSVVERYFSEPEAG